MNWILLLVFFYIFSFCLVTSAIRKTLLSPAPIFTVYLSFMLIFALMFEDGQYGYVGYFWFLGAIIAVNLGAYVGRKKFLPKNRSYTIKLKKNTIKRIILIGSSILILVALYNYFTNGGMSGAAQNAYDYYTSEARESSFLENVINQILGISSMLICLLGGFYFVLEKKKKKRLLAFIVFFYSIINMLYSTQKLSLILSAFYFFIGILVCYAYQKRSLSIRGVWLVIKKYWLLAVGAIGLFILSFMLRFGEFNAELLAESFQKLNVYAFGGFQCFNAWLSTYAQDGYKLGLETFMGIPHTLGIVDRPPGLYDTMIVVGLGKTNIYTAFRPLITDFGVFGSLLFLFLAGLLSKISFNTFRRYKTKASFFFLCVIYLYFIYSPITSPYIYLNISISFMFYLFIYEMWTNCFGPRKKKKKAENKIVLMNGGKAVA